MTFLKWFTLALVAILLFALLAPFGVVYGLCASVFRTEFKEAFDKIGRYFKSIAVSIDQTGNVFCKELFDDILIYPHIHRFGNEDETISSVLGKNKLSDSLTWAGKTLDWILNLFEKNHSIISIEHDE